MICYAIKNNNGFYWCGMNYWDKQLRKARLYNSLRWANEVLNDTRFKDEELYIVKVEINEVVE